MECEIAQKQPVNAQNIVENARLSARFRELFRPGILARTLLERIGVNYGGILVNSILRFHAQFRSFAYYVRNFTDAIFDAFCA